MAGCEVVGGGVNHLKYIDGLCTLERKGNQSRGRNERATIENAIRSMFEKPNGKLSFNLRLNPVGECYHKQGASVDITDKRETIMQIIFLKYAFSDFHSLYCFTCDRYIVVKKRTVAHMRIIVFVL